MYLFFVSCVIFISSGPFAEKSVFCTESNGEFRDVTRSLQAYLCAGVVDWATENFNFINEMEMAAALCGENGAVDEEVVVCEDCGNKSGQWRVLLDVLTIGKTTVLTKENIQYFQDCVKIKKWEHEIATAFAQSQKAVGDTSSAVDDTGCNGGTDSILIKLEELKQRKQMFERDYVSTPNPFVTYCKIKNLLFHIKEQDPKSCGDMCEQFEAVWKSVTSLV